MERQMRMAALLAVLALIAPRVSWGETHATIEKRFSTLLEQARSISDKEEQTQSLSGIGKMMCQSFPKEPGIRVLQEALALSRTIATPLARSQPSYRFHLGISQGTLGPPPSSHSDRGSTTAGAPCSTNQLSITSRGGGKS